MTDTEPKNRVQITWEDIVITADAPKGKCGKKIPNAQPKEIIRGVSGTVMPGQFLAIIGASGKHSIRLFLTTSCVHRRWQDDAP